ncbi:hypothetical protein [Microbacterium sp. NPDC086615]|uniref:hypothetical protein n=1 Tax=Microbacterium sp. NPDC086615 TaxID=3154865 RepID=UPI003439E482
MANLNDNSGWIEDIKRQLARIKSGAFLENASISDGQLRLIRAVLLLQGGALLKGEGTFDWTGPGSIAGDWEVLGGGVIRVGGVLISPIGGGRIMIGQGPVGIILDGGAGTLTMGNVRLEGNKIYVGVGTNQIVIDGATGVAHIGTSMTLDPSTDGGAALFSNGSKLYSNPSAIGLRNGSSAVTVGDALATLLAGSKAVQMSQDEVSMLGIREVDSLDGITILGLTTTNEVVKISPEAAGLTP